MDWRESGAALRAKGLGIRVLKGDDEEFAAFLEAVRAAYRRKDTSKLLDYLRSDRPLRDRERQVLARMIEDGFRPPSAKEGRPRDHELRAAAWLASGFYKAWRAQNKMLGIDDRGRGEEMKDYAARAVVEDLDWGLEPVEDKHAYAAKIVTLMNRPWDRIVP